MVSTESPELPGVVDAALTLDKTARVWDVRIDDGTLEHWAAVAERSALSRAASRICGGGESAWAAISHGKEETMLVQRIRPSAQRA